MCRERREVHAVEVWRTAASSRAVLDHREKSIREDRPAKETRQRKEREKKLEISLSRYA